jgi:iron complex transport system substrate-binding protein
MGTESADSGRPGWRPRWRHRRTSGAAALTALLLLGAVGCGADDDDAATSDEPGASGASGASGDEASVESAALPVEDGALPVTIEHRYGSTTIESEPERVVTVGLTDQDALLALGVVPVATTEWFGEHAGAIFPWAEDDLEALGAEPPESLGNSDALNVEAVAAQRPDLIVALYADVTEEDYGQLSALAPTVVPTADHVPYGIPWDEMTRTIGRAVGRPDAADGIVEDIEAEFARARDEHPEFTGASAMAATPFEGIYVYGPDDPRSRFLTSLGFELPEGLGEVTGAEFGANLSNERAEMLDVDAIVWLDPDDAEGPLGGPLYDTLAVHTEGREVPLDSFDDPLGAATSFVTPLSLTYLLDGIVPQLAAAVDGDPATAVADARPEGI